MKLQVTPEIHLSPLTPSDRDDIVHHLREKEVSQYTLLIPHPYLLEHADDWIAHAAQATEQHGRVTLWAIRDRQNRLIGGIELSPEGRGKEHCAEIGYWIAKPYWGRGIMTAVVKAVTDHGFRNCGLLRITAPIFDLNPVSGRVLEKAGFILEAPLQRHQYRRDGKLFDSRLYARVRDP